jgi:hypothetical protein
MKWQGQGLCRDKKYAGLFDEPEARNPTRSDRQRIENAISVCRRCPVQQECLAFGMKSNGSGVHGGILLRGGRKIYLPLMFARARRVEKAA